MAWGAGETDDDGGACYLCPRHMYDTKINKKKCKCKCAAMLCCFWLRLLWFCLCVYVVGG